ncbi:MAG TPA: lipid-A-disaccharide synthase, partial [Phycisphaerales bacterium]|nr:lipid-A-disaccharide synthase [Phycisphaerales bacterium]
MDVFFSTGEKSGDRIAAAVAVALRREFPNLDLAGLTGPDATSAGIRGA